MTEGSKQKAVGSKRARLFPAFCPRRTAFCTFAFCLLLSVLTGCSESWQRKFVRKNKTAQQRPAPVVQFHDYSGAMTPLERYRKHYLMFDYWNAQLLDALGTSSPNPKRFRHASQQALDELQTLHGLLQPDRAETMEPIVTARSRLHHQLQTGPYHPANLSSLRMALEAQARQIDRDMDWRNVEDQLKPPEPSP